jgi:hypothetical protein
VGEGPPPRFEGRARDPHACQTSVASHFSDGLLVQRPREDRLSTTSAEIKWT